VDALIRDRSGSAHSSRIGTVGLPAVRPHELRHTGATPARSHSATTKALKCLLSELAKKINDGRVHDRDLPGLARVLERVLQAHR
jgi:hypothetical protein